MSVSKQSANVNEISQECLSNSVSAAKCFHIYLTLHTLLSLKFHILGASGQNLQILSAASV